MIILVEYNDKQSWTLIQDVQTDVEDSSLEETFTLIHWCSTSRSKQTHAGLRQPDKVPYPIYFNDDDKTGKTQ